MLFDAVAASGAFAVSLPAAPLQSLDPSALLDAPATVRAAIGFVAAVVFGGGVIYGYGGRLEAAVEASTASPLVSALYGFVAYGVVVFLVAYAYSQLSRLGVGTALLATAGAVVLAGLLLSLGGLGFVVVGSWATGLVGVRDPWLGLVGASSVGAVALLALPLVAGLLVWFAIAAVGVGGPVRRWLHADAAERRAR